MSGIEEFRADGSFKLIVAELPGGDLGLTQVDEISGQRFSITMKREVGEQVAHCIRFVTRPGRRYKPI